MSEHCMVCDGVVAADDDYYLVRLDRDQDPDLVCVCADCVRAAEGPGRFADIPRHLLPTALAAYTIASRGGYDDLVLVDSGCIVRELAAARVGRVIITYHDDHVDAVEHYSAADARDAMSRVRAAVRTGGSVIAAAREGALAR